MPPGAVPFQGNQGVNPINQQPNQFGLGGVGIAGNPLQVNPAINIGAPNINQFQAAGPAGFGGVNQGQNAFIGGNPNAFGLGANPNGLGLGGNAFGLGATGSVVVVDAAGVDVDPTQVGGSPVLEQRGSAGNGETKRVRGTEVRSTRRARARARACVCVCVYLHTQCLLNYTVAVRETSLTATRLAKGLPQSKRVGKTSAGESFGMDFIGTRPW